MNIFIDFPQLQKITLDSINIASNKISGKDFDFKLSFSEMGWDGIDIVEFIMELEKLNDININDNIGEKFLDETLHFGKTFISLIREDQINKLLNDEESI